MSGQGTGWYNKSDIMTDYFDVGGITTSMLANGTRGTYVPLDICFKMW